MRKLPQTLSEFQVTTAEITYRLPNQPGRLETYIWQGLDVAPDYPVLSGFLEYWQRELNGPLHSVTIAACEAPGPSDLPMVTREITLH